MYRDGFTPDKGHVKSARTVGNVMASLHPHGDSSIYDAMGKLAQPWYLNVKYVDGYGNWGDVGGSTPAAPRYTEAKLDKNAMLMLEELREKTVDMKPNYDGEEEEPTVLPVQFPALVINGTFGLAVGFSSNMAPHNPGEVLDATRWLLTHPDATLDKLMSFIPGPDFPTGGQILGMDAVRESYETGKGKIQIRSTYHVEDLGRGKHNIIFTEMPYGAKTVSILKKIKDGRDSQKLIGIADVKDLTDLRNGTRLVVETKTGVKPEALVMELFKQTPLQETYAINNVALVKENLNGKMMDVPKTLGLKEMLEIFIAHRVDVVTRRTQHRKDKKDARLHILEGMLKALANIDEVIRIIRAAPDASTAQVNLMKKFKLDEIQADYILSIPLRRLTKFDQIELNEEKIKLTDEVKELSKILSDDKELRAVIATELTAVKKQLDRPRRSVLVGGSLAEHIAEAKKAVASISLEVADEPCVISLTAKGSIVRNAKPVRNALSTATTTTRGKFIVVTNKGRAFRIDALHVGEKAAAVGSVLPSALAAGEKCVAVTPVTLEDGKTGGIALGTKRGVVKLQPVNWPKNSDIFDIITLADGDEIIGARWVSDVETTSYVFVSSDSSLLIFKAATVRGQNALSSAGMAGIKLAEGEQAIEFSVITDTELDKAVVVTHTGQTGKASKLSLFNFKGRATGGMRAQKFNRGEENLVFATVSTSPVLVSESGDDIPVPDIDPRRDGSGKPFSAVPFK
jgi:DNA gyrase subunit A